MPLKGPICCQTGLPGNFEHCLAAARGTGPRMCQHPLPLMKFMATKEQSRQGVGLSATGIISCPRQSILLSEVDYWEPPEKIMPLFRGDVWHAAMEMWVKDEPDIISERRLEKEVEGIVLSGKPDQVTPSRGLIVDYKSTNTPVDCEHLVEWPGLYAQCEKRKIKAAKEEHEQQVNIYAWMHRGGRYVDTGEPVDIRITAGGIIYIDGRTSKKFPVRIWSDAEQNGFVRSRVFPRLQYLATGDLPPVLLPDKITTSKKTGRRVVKRNWRCRWCPVKNECDEIAVAETDLHPDEAEYYDWAYRDGD